MSGINPYWGKTFFPFLRLLLERSILWCRGELPSDALASDELQIAMMVIMTTSMILVGGLLVFRQMTMLANALSHTVLLGIVVVYLLLSSPHDHPTFLSIDLQMMMIAALLTALCTTWCTQILSKNLRVESNASIGLVFTLFFALGVFLVTLFTKNTHLGAEVIMGNIDAIHLSDVKHGFWVLLLNLFCLVSFRQGWLISTFDGGFARGVGIYVKGLDLLLVFLTSLTVIVSFRSVGLVLSLSLLVSPILFARMCARTWQGTLLLACGVGIAVSVFAVATTRHLLSCYQIPLSTSGLISTLFLLLYLLGLLPVAKKAQRV